MCVGNKDGVVVVKWSARFDGAGLGFNGRGEEGRGRREGGGGGER